MAAMMYEMYNAVSRFRGGRFCKGNVPAVRYRVSAFDVFVYSDILLSIKNCSRSDIESYLRNTGFSRNGFIQSVNYISKFITFGKSFSVRVKKIRFDRADVIKLLWFAHNMRKFLKSFLLWDKLIITAQFELLAEINSINSGQTLAEGFLTADTALDDFQW